MVDATVVSRKLSELELYRKQLQEFSGVSLAEYKANWKTQRIVERTLQMMIETCADIANHLVSDGGMRAPTGYADTFKVLMENSVLDSGLAGVMEKMAKFRNVVVHQYEGVDAEIVMVILTKHLPDFDRYREAIISYMKSREKS